LKKKEGEKEPFKRKWKKKAKDQFLIHQMLNDEVETIEFQK